MQFFDLTYPDPADNLAMDEALLDAAESGLAAESLRVWESPVYFVVLGYASKWKNEVRETYCRDHAIPILRRKSGGATVLQGPGCLNFNLILRAHPQSGIRSDTQRVMKLNLQAVQSLRIQGNIQIQGVSDLTLDEKKFSGNAMRRGKDYFLFHGTFLYGFDLDRIPLTLGHPDREPGYRARRTHQDFLTTLPASKEKIIAALRQIWQADIRSDKIQTDSLQDLKNNFYGNSDWNLKY